MPFLVRSRNEGEPTSCVSNTAVFPSRSITPSTFTRMPQRAGLQALAALDRGETPPWLQRSERRALFKIAQHGGCLAVAEVALPAPQVRREVLHHSC